MSDSYLFVSHNKVDGGTAESCHRPTKSAIKSHARTNRITELKASRRAHVEFDILTPSGYQKKRAAKNLHRAASKNQIEPTPSLIASSTKPQRQSSLGQSPSPITLLNTGNHDPFNSTALDLDPLATHLITFITTHHASMIWPLEFSGERDTSPTKQGWKNMVRDIVMEQAQLASFLAFGAALKLQVHGRPHLPLEDVQALESVIVRYRSVAVQGVVQHLGSKSADLVVLSTVLHLLCLEMYLPNLGLARTHLSALASITTALGGVSKLSFLYREYFLSISVRAAYVLNEELPVEVRKWDSGPLRDRPKTWTDPSLATEIPRLLSGSYETSLDLYPLCDKDVAALMDELREIFVLEELRDIKLQDAEKYREIYRWIRMRVVSTRYRMCRLRMAHLGLLTQAVDALGIQRPSPLGERIYITIPNAPPSTSQSPLVLLRNAFLCLGATFCAAISLYRAREKLDYWGVYVEWEKWLLYCIDNFFLLRQSVDPRRASEQVRQDPIIATTEERTDLEIVLWATISGAIAHPMQRSSSLATLKRFDGIVRQLMSLLGLRSYPEVRNTCERLLWHDSVMDPALRNIMCGGL